MAHHAKAAESWAQKEYDTVGYELKAAVHGLESAAGRARAEAKAGAAKAASEKGMPSLQRGDKLTIVVTAQNEFIDFHLADQPGWDRIVKGRVAQPVVGDQRWAVIRTAEGRLEPNEMAAGNDARQKVLNIPVDVPALFLLNKANLIIDATFGDERALLQTLAQWSKDRQRMIRP